MELVDPLLHGHTVQLSTILLWRSRIGIMLTLQWQRMCGRVSSVDWDTRHSGEKSSLHLDLFLLVGTTFIRARCTNLESCLICMFNPVKCMFNPVKCMFNPVNIQEDPLAKAYLTIAQATFP
jgi:hypothetical protein